MNSWKEPFNTYDSSTWIISLIWLVNWFSGLLSIGHYRSFLSAAAILFILVMQKSSSSYERIKNKHVTVLLSNQKARKRHTLILQELFPNKQHIVVNTFPWTLCIHFQLKLLVSVTEYSRGTTIWLLGWTLEIGHKYSSFLWQCCGCRNA